LGAKGDQAVVFTPDGYMVFAGTKMVEAAKHAGSVWLPDPAARPPSPKEVEASPWTDGTATLAPNPEASTSRAPAPDGTSGASAGLPAAPMLLLSLVVAVMLRRRR